MTKPVELGTRMDPEESHALLKLTNVLGIYEAARLADVSPTTMARAVGRQPLYTRTKRRLREFLARQASAA